MAGRGHREFEHDSGSLQENQDSLWWASFGSLWALFGLPLAPFGCPSALFGLPLAPVGFPLTPFGPLWASSGCFGGWFWIGFGVSVRFGGRRAVVLNFRLGLVAPGVVSDWF